VLNGIPVSSAISAGEHLPGSSYLFLSATITASLGVVK
jgi:hypothetical protein